VCNFIPGFSPTFWFLFLFRALLGIGMGAEWPAGAALAMESWPARSRGLMSGILQGSWSIGFLLSSAAYGLLHSSIGWRGLLWIGIIPALAIHYVRRFVQEPAVWVENRRKQREQQKEFRAPLLDIFRPRVLWNTITACLWMGSSFIVYYLDGSKRNYVGLIGRPPDYSAARPNSPNPKRPPRRVPHKYEITDGSNVKIKSPAGQDIHQRFRVVGIIARNRLDANHQRPVSIEHRRAQDLNIQSFHVHGEEIRKAASRVLRDDLVQRQYRKRLHAPDTKPGIFAHECLCHLA
jgi:hypothetical protein